MQYVNLGKSGLKVGRSGLGNAEGHRYPSSSSAS
jgi:aryl-alcohol dehydrogenase-like predicted oxidoreductase